MSIYRKNVRKSFRTSKVDFGNEDCANNKRPNDTDLEDNAGKCQILDAESPGIKVRKSDM